MQKRNILIGFTGSVASRRDKGLIDSFLETDRFNIKIIFSSSAVHFSEILKEEDARSAKEYKGCQIILDEDEWKWQTMGDPVLHIDLKNWAEIFLIAPLSANTLAKIANGFCDSTITLILRAWKFDQGKIVNPIVVCPAMNTNMYLHPITEKQLSVLKSWGFKIVPPIEKMLACKEVGLGAMEEVPNIIKIVTGLTFPGENRSSNHSVL